VDLTGTRYTQAGFRLLPPAVTIILTVAAEVPLIESFAVSGIAASVMAGVVGVSDSASLRIFPSPIQPVAIAFLFLAAVPVIAVVTVISVGIRRGTVYPALAFQQGALPFAFSLALALQFPGAPLFVVTPLLVVALRISSPGFMPFLLLVSMDFLSNLTFRVALITLRLTITPILRLSC
jgi:hypothetical protein